MRWANQVIYGLWVSRRGSYNGGGRNIRFCYSCISKYVYAQNHIGTILYSLCLPFYSYHYSVGDLSRNHPAAHLKIDMDSKIEISTMTAFFYAMKLLYRMRGSRTMDSSAYSGNLVIPMVCHYPLICRWLFECFIAGQRFPRSLSSTWSWIFSQSTSPDLI